MPHPPSSCFHAFGVLSHQLLTGPGSGLPVQGRTVYPAIGLLGVPNSRISFTHIHTHLDRLTDPKIKKTEGGWCLWPQNILFTTRREKGKDTAFIRGYSRRWWGSRATTLHTHFCFILSVEHGPSFGASCATTGPRLRAQHNLRPAPQSNSAHSAQALFFFCPLPSSSAGQRSTSSTTGVIFWHL